MGAWVMTGMDVSIQGTVTTWIWKRLFWTARGQKKGKKMSKTQSALYSRLPWRTTARLLCKFSWKGEDTCFKCPKGDDSEICCNCNKFLVRLNHNFAVGWVIPIMKLVLSQIFFSTLVFFYFVTFTQAHPKGFLWDAHCFNGYSKVTEQ